MITAGIIDIRELREGPAGGLFEKSVYRATPAKLDQLMNALEMSNGQAYLARDGEEAIGLIAAIRTGEGHLEIKALFVEEESRGNGAGRSLVSILITDNEDPIIQAETDDDAVRFYHSLGFRIRSLGEKYPGIIRYRCTYDHLAWEAHRYDEIIRVMRDAGITCWVSGGMAIDLHIGTQTREHLDVDISILRKDQARLRELFSDWEIYHTHAPGLRFWRDGRYLPEIPNVWVRKNQESSWAFEVMFQDNEMDSWVYRRNRSVRRSNGSSNPFTRSFQMATTGSIS